MKYFCPLIFILGLLLSDNSFSKTPPPICYGSRTSEGLIVYLHGLDSSPPSKQELDNRKKLQAQAKTQNIAVAVVRASDTCRHYNKTRLCWPSKPWEKILSTFTELRAAAITCAPKAKRVHYVAFSNGGYFAGKLFQGCAFNKSDQITLIGSAGGLVAWQKKDLSACGKATVMIGRKDKLTIAKSKKYFNLLKKLDADVSLVEYDGGHDFVKAPF